MAGFNIDSYRSVFQGGARQYLFHYSPNFPRGVGKPSDFSYLVRSTSLPEKTSEEITTNWMGNDFKIHSKTTYNDWTVSVFVDLDSEIIKQFQAWSEIMHNPRTNLRTRHNEYMRDQHVQLLTLNGLPSIEYKIVGAWPKTIGAANVDYTANELVSFELTFTYVYHEIVKPTNRITI
jgi:hypothetical protein